MKLVSPSPAIAQPFPPKALAALFAGAVSISFVPILVRVSEVGPIATAFWRFALAVLPLWVWMKVENRNGGGSRRPHCAADVLRLAAAGFFLAADLSFWHFSIGFTSVANATLLVNFAPLFVTLGAWLWFKQRTTPLFMGGLALALAGATLLIGVSLRFSSRHLLGDGLALLAAVFYGGYILSVKDLRRTFSTATIMTWAGVVSAAILLPLTFLSGERLLGMGWEGWLILLALAVVSHAGGQSLIAYALAHLPAAFSSVSLLLQPVMATVWAWTLLNEAIGPWQAAGGVIVLAGIVIARQGSLGREGG